MRARSLAGVPISACLAPGVGANGEQKLVQQEGDADLQFNELLGVGLFHESG